VPEAGLSHRSSAATVRISLICRSGAIRGARERRASHARCPYRRGTKYSLCSSSPRLGVKPVRKWGSRSCQAPGRPNWSVRFSTGMSVSMCVGTVAARAPKKSSGATPGSSARDLTQT
jgi:hypothetical protein